MQSRYFLLFVLSILPALARNEEGIDPKSKEFTAGPGNT